jgi:hypothetical protein
VHDAVLAHRSPHPACAPCAPCSASPEKGLKQARRGVAPRLSVPDGTQATILGPTTLLVQQHRSAGPDPRPEQESRFRAAADRRGVSLPRGRPTPGLAAAAHRRDLHVRT